MPDPKRVLWYLRKVPLLADLGPDAIARMALAVTELRGGDTVRTSRLVTADVSPDPSAQSAPRAGRERRSTGVVTIPDAVECAKVMNP